MRIERLEFPEAVEQLAKRAGVPLPERDSGQAGRRESLYEINEQAAQFFRETLKGPAGADARGYLAKRGLSAALVEQYGLGFAPPSGTALSGWLTQRRVPRQAALALGLLGSRQDGSTYDRFRGRVMFPIRDRRGHIVGFGGRTLGSDQPKYLNSPESPVFHKGEGLYGLAEAREPIRTANRVVVVEGYMDVLLLVQHGIPYAVAVLGTALTERQLLSLRPFGGDEVVVYFFFDGDQAGRRAAKRACAEAFKACVDAGLWGRAAFLPEGFDPDSYVRQHGGPATVALLESASALEDVYFDCVAPPSGATLQERQRAVEEVRQMLATARSEVQRELLRQRAEARLGLAGDLLPAPPVTRAAATARPPVAASPRAWAPAEILLIEALAADQAVAAGVAARGSLALFRDAELAQAGAALIEAWSEHGSIGHVVEALPEALGQRLTAAILGTGPAPEADRMRVAEDCVAKIERDAQRAARRTKIEELRSAERGGDAERSQEKLLRVKELLPGSGGHA
jgi:DNA primase